MRVLVLGGGGFIGRHACEALRARGHAVVIGSRRAGRADARLGAALRAMPRVEVQFARLTQASGWRPLIAGFDAVLNCVGILRARWGESYEAVHHAGVAALAQAVAATGCRLVHVSALGLDPHARSEFIRSKWRGERALEASGAAVVIVRPSLLDGAGGFGARWLRRVAAWPVHCVPRDSGGRIAPLQAADLGEALAALCEQPIAHGTEIVELGGSDIRSMAEHLAALRRERGLDASRVVVLPPIVARAVSHVCDLLHATPFSFGHLELMRHDNVPAYNALPRLLGRVPAAVGVRVDASSGADDVPAIAMLQAGRRALL